MQNKVDENGQKNSSPFISPFDRKFAKYEDDQ